MGEEKGQKQYRKNRAEKIRNCCQKGRSECKDCCGRVPLASLIGAFLMVTAFTFVLIGLESGLNHLDNAFKIIGNYHSYEKYRNMITAVIRISIFSTYGFAGVFLLVAFLASGNNRNCYKSQACCRRNMLTFIVMVMIVMCLLYCGTLLSVALISVPITLAKMARTACSWALKMTNHPLAKKACVNVLFLGSEAQDLCDKNAKMNDFCNSMDEAVKFSWMCFVCLIVANIGIVIVLVAFGANFAYLKSLIEYEREKSREKREAKEAEDRKLMYQATTVIHDQDVAQSEGSYRPAVESRKSNEDTFEEQINDVASPEVARRDDGSLRRTSRKTEDTTRSKRSSSRHKPKANIIGSGAVNDAEATASHQSPKTHQSPAKTQNANDPYEVKTNRAPEKDPAMQSDERQEGINETNAQKMNQADSEFVLR